MSFRPLLTQGAVRGKLHRAKVKLAWSISLQLTNGLTDVTLVDKDADGANMKIVLTRSSTISAPSWFDISSEVHYQLYYSYQSWQW